MASIKMTRFRSVRAVIALLLREMGATYGKSPGGYFWAVAEPVAAIAVMAVAFQLVFRSPSLGTNFPLFFATGVLPYTLALDLSAKVAKAIGFSKPLLFYPAVTVFDSIVARAVLSIITNITISVIVLVGIHLVFDLHSFVRPEAVALSVAMAVALGLGIGVLNCYLTNAFSLWQRIWGIATRPLLLASGVIFLYDSLPAFPQAILWYNPFLHVVGMMRVGFYATYDGSYLSPLYVFGLSFCLLSIGLLLLRRYGRKLVHG